MRAWERMKLDQVNAVITREMLPQCTADVPHAIHFQYWEFSGFAPDPSSTINLIARISAQYKGDGSIHSVRVMIDVDVLAHPPKKMFEHIDAHLVGKVKALVNDVIGDHHLL